MTQNRTVHDNIAGLEVHTKLVEIHQGRATTGRRTPLLRAKPLLGHPLHALLDVLAQGAGEGDSDEAVALVARLSLGVGEEVGYGLAVEGPRLVGHDQHVLVEFGVGGQKYTLVVPRAPRAVVRARTNKINVFFVFGFCFFLRNREIRFLFYCLCLWV